MKTQTFKDYLTIGMLAAKKMTPYSHTYGSADTKADAYRAGFRDGLCWAAGYLYDCQVTGLPPNALDVPPDSDMEKDPAMTPQEIATNTVYHTTNELELLRIENSGLRHQFAAATKLAQDAIEGLANRSMSGGSLESQFKPYVDASNALVQVAIVLEPDEK